MKTWRLYIEIRRRVTCRNTATKARKNIMHYCYFLNFSCFQIGLNEKLEQTWGRLCRALSENEAKLNVTEAFNTTIVNHRIDELGHKVKELRDSRLSPEKICAMERRRLANDIQELRHIADMLIAQVNANHKSSNFTCGFGSRLERSQLDCRECLFPVQLCYQFSDPEGMRGLVGQERNRTTTMLVMTDITTTVLSSPLLITDYRSYNRGNILYIEQLYIK
ncbi:unnamed protein product [Angiostrongylus costaricensis]|uniref:Tektin n=1 Tax=Angiostrongylus costaricensis TaxID=334426 RepID=A0A0R3PNU8_ANGCS|nr:unnamed protein product [Angiostrongylus costaricensis]